MSGAPDGGGTPGGPLPEAGGPCAKNADCEGFADRCNPVACVAGKCLAQTPISCDDADPCTADACDPESGACSHTAVTYDLDKDGHRGPLPGHAPGDPGSCGDDCNDANPNAFPGNKEVCDGVDNDCNGVVDDGAHWAPKPGAVDAVRVSGQQNEYAEPGGLAYNGTSYLATYTGSVGNSFRVLESMLDPSGKSLSGEKNVTNADADEGGSSVVWTGDRFGIAWTDRRDGNYEVYFALLGPDGAKIAPGDLRLTNATGFSVNTSLVWTGKEFVVTWQDDRPGNAAIFQVYAQRLDLDGNRIGPNVQLTKTTESSESPSHAAGTHSMGFVWTTGEPKSHGVFFTPYDFELKAKGKTVEITGPGADGIFPNIVWNSPNYVVTWWDSLSAQKAVWAAVVSESGAIVVKPQIVTQSPKHARYPALLPLGDRLLLVYSDDRDGNTGYEIYSMMLDPKLGALQPAERVTKAIGDSVWPVPAFGPQGNVGVLFRDDRSGLPQVFFTALVCQTK